MYSSNLTKNSTASLTTALSALTILSLGMMAQASPYPGSLATLTNGAGNIQSLFTVSGNGITVTGDTSGANTYYLDGTQLVGFRSIYLVNPNGLATSGIATAANGGFVTDGSTMTKTYYNGSPALGGYTGYDDNGSGKGFSDGSHWLVIANPMLAGNSASNNDTSGSFSFNGPVGNYDIGLDYILKGGQTGRSYFVVPARLASVPEPGTYASFAVGGLGLMGLMVRARRRAR